MRPIRLQLKGFTAFRDEQAIDFVGLDLFAISGQTGSGKSSILDAMTYALYGYVERVGKQVGQLVSQGQLRMAVTLEFEVGEDRYRVTRSTPSARGTTKIQLERRRDGGWEQAGEGSDRVREAGALIEGAVGLDYPAFTRTVLLPQGRFAEFLVGDAGERRKILTDLLGLELFERLARLAGDRRRDAEVDARAKQTVLERMYASVTPEALADAERDEGRARARDDALASVEDQVRQLAERWASAEHTRRELVACAREARDAERVATQVVTTLEGLNERSEVARASLAARRAEATTAAKAARKARGALAKAVARWGDTGSLSALIVRAEGLGEVREALAQVEVELERAEGVRAQQARAAADVGRTVSEALDQGQVALEALEAAREAHEQTAHADRVASVRAGVKVGDPCPVCGQPVQRLPRGPRHVSLDKARGALAAAEQGAGAAQQAIADAQRASDVAMAAVEAAESERERLVGEADKRRQQRSAIEAGLAAAFHEKLPGDPMAVLEERRGRLDELQTAAASALESAERSDEALRVSERENERLAAEVAQARARLQTVSLTGIAERVSQISTGVAALDRAPTFADGDDVDVLYGKASTLAGSLSSLISSLEQLVAESEAGEGPLLAEANAAAADLVPVASSLAELSASLAAERRVTAGVIEAAKASAEQLRTQLADVQQLLEEIETHGARAARFEVLAKELRQDRIISFLQQEALQLLAAAGSDRLSTLSSSRYRLEFEEDEFYVVDVWNGEERRSARTLSGGETFLASLALALALSEQARSLAVEEKARLDSLFLDEGFGTLDPETLDVVVDAIEQLGGDGRMVGVITHVQELAIRLPARIEVEKSPRGSRLVVAS